MRKQGYQMTTYKDTGIEIQKIPARKTRTKHIIKGRTSKQSGWKAPTQVRCSSIYDSVLYMKPQPGQDSKSTNKMAHSREWGQQ